MRSDLLTLIAVIVLAAILAGTYPWGEPLAAVADLITGMD